MFTATRGSVGVQAVRHVADLYNYRLHPQYRRDHLTETMNICPSGATDGHRWTKEVATLANGDDDH